MFLTAPSVFSQQRVYSTARRDYVQPLPQTIQGGTTSTRAALANARTGLSLATGDFNSDGTQDLITGYATPAGGVLLFQAGNAAALTGTGGRPFISSAQAIALPVRPDLMHTTGVSGHGTSDLLVAARGDSSIYLLAGDGRGGFSTPTQIVLQGTITSLLSWKAASGTELIAAGVCGGASGCGVQLLTTDGKTAAFIHTSGAVKAIEVGAFNGGFSDDLALIAGTSVLVVDGDSILSGTPSMETVSVGSAASAFTGGHLVYSRKGSPQLAILGSDATLHIFSRGPLDTSVPTQAESLAARKALAAQSRQALGTHAVLARLNNTPWIEVQTIPNVGPGGDALMLHGHLSGNGQDDVVVMAGGQYLQITQSATLENNTRTNTPVVIVDSTNAQVLAAVTARTAGDVRIGVITAEGAMQPNYSAQFTVNRTMNANVATDAVPNSTTMNACINGTAGCTLRAAIAVANNDAASNGTAKVDTINLTATSAYNLTATNNGSTTDLNGSANYHLNLEGSVNIVGAASPATNIVDGQANDLVFNMNPGIQNAPANLDVYLTGFTVRNGANPTDNSLGYNYGGAIQSDVYNSGLLTLTNMTVSGSTSRLGPGGCLAIIDSNNGNQTPGGTVDLESSSFTGCKTPEYGGGIDTEAGVILTANNITVSNNMSGHSINTADTGSSSLGGGLAVAAGYSAAIATSTFSNNSTLAATAVAAGGGGLFLNALHGVSITNSSITANSSLSYGGGLFIDPSVGVTTTLTADTVTSNNIGSGATAGSDGAGIFVNNNAASNTVPSLSMQFSRIHGNTGGGSHTGLYIADAQGSINSTATFNATDNWWGCNVAPTVSPCDIAAVASNTGTLNTTPFSQLLIAINPPSPVTLGATLTATASMAQDSVGTVYSTANDFAYLATPITSFTLTNTGTVTYSPSATAFSSTAAPTYSNAAATESGTTTTTGGGTASITVDGVTATAPYTVVSPADLTVAATHTGNFKASDTADTFTLTATNSGGASTSGTVTVKDTLPNGFTASAITGTGWSCTLATLTCTRSDGLAATSSYPPITLTVSVSSSNAGNYTNTVMVSGGGETVTTNDTGTDTVIVVAPPTISQSFTPATIAIGGSSILTFTIGNPAANTVSLTGVAFADSLPAGLVIATPSGATTTCSGTFTASPGGSTDSLSGATIASGASCTASVNVTSAARGTYINTTGNIAATNSNSGQTASANLKVVTPETVSLGIVPATENRGSSSTFTGTVTVDADAPAPTLQLAFYAGSTLLGSAPLTGSGTTYTATFSTAMLPSGTQSILARYPGDTTYPLATSTSQSTFVIANNLWIGNSNSTVSAYSATGVPYLTTPETAGSGRGVAIDSNGNVWSLNAASVAKFTNTGTVVSAGYTGGGLANTTGIAIDGSGQVWVTNTSNSISVLGSTGTPISSTPYAGGALNAPQSPALDSAGNLWVVNPSGDSVTEFIGVASPTVTLANGVANNTTGTKP
jgi:hypothetical protein